MNRNEVAVTASLIWQEIRPLITSEDRREAAQVLFIQFKLDGMQGTLPATKLLLRMQVSYATKNTKMRVTCAQIRLFGGGSITSMMGIPG